MSVTANTDVYCILSSGQQHLVPACWGEAQRNKAPRPATVVRCAGQNAAEALALQTQVGMRPEIKTDFPHSLKTLKRLRSNLKLR